MNNRIIQESRCVYLQGNFSKGAALQILIEEARKTGNLISFDEYRKAVLARESLMTTGIGRGIGVPHGITDAVIMPFLIIGIFPDGIDYDALDSKNVKAVFLIGSPPTEEREYLRILARLSRIFRNEDNLRALIESGNCDSARSFMTEKWDKHG